MGCSSSKTAAEGVHSREQPRKLQTETIHIQGASPGTGIPVTSTAQSPASTAAKYSDRQLPIAVADGGVSQQHAAEENRQLSPTKAADIRASDNIVIANSHPSISPRQTILIGRVPTSENGKAPTIPTLKTSAIHDESRQSLSPNITLQQPNTGNPSSTVVPMLRAPSAPKLASVKSYYGGLRSARTSPRPSANRPEDKIVDALASKEFAIHIAGSQLSQAAGRRARRGEIAGEAAIQDTVSSLVSAIQANAATSPNNTDWQTFANSIKVVPKTQDERMLIAEALGRNFMFAGMSTDEKRVIIDAMERRNVPAGEVVIAQGTVGEQCYVIQSGLLEVLVNNEKDVELEPGSFCGELALLYGVASESTVRAIYPSSLWALDRQTFRSVVLAAAIKQYEDAKRFLAGVALLSSLSESQIGRLAEAAQRVTFTAGTRIIQQGDVGQVFYLVMKGNVKVVKVMETPAASSSDEDDEVDDDDDDSEEEVTEATILHHVSNRGSIGLGYMGLSSDPSNQPASNPSSPEAGTRDPSNQTSPAPTAAEIDNAKPPAGAEPGGVRKATLSLDAELDPDLLENEMLLMKLSVGSWFGEQALLHDQPRAASVIADGDATCLALSRDQFFQLLGPLQDILNTQHVQRKEVERTVRALHQASSPRVESTVMARVASFMSGGTETTGESPTAAGTRQSPSGRHGFIRQFTFTEEQMKISAIPGADAPGSDRRASDFGRTPARQNDARHSSSSTSTTAKRHSDILQGSGEGASVVSQVQRSPATTSSPPPQHPAILPAVTGPPTVPSPQTSPSTGNGAGAMPAALASGPKEKTTAAEQQPVPPSVRDDSVNPVTGLPSLRSLQKMGGAASIIGPKPDVTRTTSPQSSSDVGGGMGTASSTFVASTAAATNVGRSPSLAPIAEEGGKRNSTSNRSGGAANSSARALPTMSPIAAAYTGQQLAAGKTLPPLDRSPSQKAAEALSTSSPGPLPANAGSGVTKDAGATASKKGLASTAYASLRTMRPEVKLSDLEFIAVLGEGAFGLVRLVRNRLNGEVYALKQMQKARIVATNQQRNVMNEKRILSRLHHPYIIEFVKTFKDKDCLFLLSEYCPGGDLFGTLIRAGGILALADATWYAAVVALVLEYVHSLDIVYRDLKPENLLLDREGFLKVCDFGFAKVVTDRTYTLCGTPEYLAPELVQGRGHGKGVDWWALGILIYEMLAGFSPFADHEANEQVTIYKNILRGNLKFPSSFRDSNAKDIVKRFLTASPSARLGCLKGGAVDVRKHKFFEKVDWEALYRKAIPPPIKPVIKSATDTSNFDEFTSDTRIQPYVDTGDAWDADF